MVLLAAVKEHPHPHRTVLLRADLQGAQQSLQLPSGMILNGQSHLSTQDVLRPPELSDVDAVHSNANRELAQGQKLTSRNQAHILVMQHDGNLVHYNGGRAVWSSETGGKGSGPYCLVLQEDNNAVVYGQGGSVIWATNTNGRGSAPARFVMQDDGNIVMYGASGKVIWARL